MNNSLINKATRFVIIGFVAVSCIEIICYLMQINLMNDYFLRDLYSEEVFLVLADKNDARVSLVGGLWSVFLFLSFFIIGRWLYVSAKTNQLLGVEKLRVTPGWAVGWFFVPFANLVMPYRALKEIYKASFNNGDWEQNPVPFHFPVWWTFWITTSVLGNVYSRMYDALGDSYTFTDLNEISYLGIGSNVSAIVSAYFLLIIVNVVAKNQGENSPISTDDATGSRLDGGL